MKKIGLVLLIILLNSCIKDDDYHLPEIEGVLKEINEAVIDIAQVKNIFIQEAGYFGKLSGKEKYTFWDQLYMEGYVISSDESGNFYQELILQDKPENPEHGIKLMLQADPLYFKYQIGQKLIIDLKGFTIGFSNGVLALGLPGTTNDYIGKAPKSFLDKIIRTEIKEEIIPLSLDIPSVLSGEYDNLYVELDGIQFTAETMQDNKVQTFAGEAEDYFDALRTLESCNALDKTYLITSTFADFKTWKLPQSSGSLRGIVVKTYNGSDYAIKLSYPDEINFSRERCGKQGGAIPEDPDIPGEAVEPEAPAADALMAFAGADFEDWNLFLSGLNNSGIPGYVKQSKGTGIGESHSLHIVTDPGTTPNNDYIFIATPLSGLPADYQKITFFLKGSSSKSLSINLYKSDGDYYKFNLKSITKNTILSPVGSNQYTGSIDTDGKWVLIQLDISRLDDLNIENTSSEFLAIKIGKQANYDLHLDHFTIE